MPVLTQPKLIRCIYCGWADWAPKFKASRHDCLNVKPEITAHCSSCTFSCPADEWDAMAHDCCQSARDVEAHRLADTLRRAGYSVTKEHA
jgi:hypothetical protein